MKTLFGMLIALLICILIAGAIFGGDKAFVIGFFVFLIGAAYFFGALIVLYVVITILKNIFSGGRDHSEDRNY